MELDEEHIREIEEAYYDFEPTSFEPKYTYDEPWD